MKNKNLCPFTHPTCIYGNLTVCRALSEVQQVIKKRKTKLLLEALVRNCQNKSGRNVDWSVWTGCLRKRDKPDATFILWMRIVGTYAVPSEAWGDGGLSAVYAFLWFGSFTSMCYFCNQGKKVKIEIFLWINTAGKQVKIQYLWP